MSNKQLLELYACLWNMVGATVKRTEVRQDGTIRESVSEFGVVEFSTDCIWYSHGRYQFYININAADGFGLLRNKVGFMRNFGGDEGLVFYELLEGAMV